MDIQKPSITQEQTVDFLLAEYETLRDLRQNLVSLGESRINFFLASVSGATVGLALISQIRGREELIFFVSGGIVMGLFVVGMITFARTVARNMSITVYTRGMNRVRHWFVEQGPDIEKYLILPINDDRPSFPSMGFISRRAGAHNLAELTAVINSTIAGAGASILANVVLALQITWVILIGIVSFIVILLVQNRYLRASIKEMENNTSVNFPASE